jgi:hypothetical protein
MYAQSLNNLNCKFANATFGTCVNGVHVQWYQTLSWATVKYTEESSSHLLKYPVRMHQTISNVKTQLITLISTGTVARSFCARVEWKHEINFSPAERRMDAFGEARRSLISEKALPPFKETPFPFTAAHLPSLVSRTSSHPLYISRTVVRALIIPVHRVWIRRARNVILSFRLSVAKRARRPHAA